MRKYDVYISYSRQDAPIARNVCYGLEGYNIRCFLDHDLLGIEWETLKLALSQSKAVILFYSENSLQSNWVKNDLLYAIQNKIPIIPIMLDDTPLQGVFRHYLADKQGFILDEKVINPWKWEEFLNEIARRIQSHLNKDSVNSSTPEDNIDPKTSLSPENNIEENEEICNRQEQSLTIKKIGIWVKNALCFIAVLVYTLLIKVSFENGNYAEGIILIVGAIVVLFMVLFLLFYGRSEYTLKLFCDADLDSEIGVSVDGQPYDKINQKGVVLIRRKKGCYIITLTPNNNSLASQSFKYTFSKANDGEIIEFTLKQKKTEEPKSDNFKRYKCFIAGSTSLTNERNATRATLSRLYNKWEDQKLIISSYTFEDFSNKHLQQTRYDEFIEKGANCAIFLVRDGVGDKTVEEYRLAVKTFEKTTTRPTIFVYLNDAVKDESVVKFMEEVTKNGSYWREYKDIESLTSKIWEDIDGELFAIFKLGLNK